MTCQDRQSLKQLTAWFVDRLDRCEIQFGDEPMSYESNTGYDLQFYRLQKEAAAYWAQHHGEVPTPGLLMKAFFNAEYERSARAKTAGTGLGEIVRGQMKRIRTRLSGVTTFFKKTKSAKTTVREF